MEAKDQFVSLADQVSSNAQILSSFAAQRAEQLSRGDRPSPSLQGLFVDEAASDEVQRARKSLREAIWELQWLSAEPAEWLEQTQLWVIPHPSMLPFFPSCVNCSRRDSPIHLTSLVSNADILLVHPILLPTMAPPLPSSPPHPPHRRWRLMGDRGFGCEGTPVKAEEHRAHGNYIQVSARAQP